MNPDNLTPLQRLDQVLLYIAGIQGIVKQTELFGLFGSINTFQETQMILEKLVKDGYLKYSSQDVLDKFSPKNTFEPTFEGMVFAQQGGYVAESENALRENTRLINLETSRQTQQRALNVLTLCIAIGTGFAALYYVFELVHDLCRWLH